MREEFANSIKEAKKLVSLIKDPAHNLIHVKSVVKFSTEIAKCYGKVDIDLVKVAAWWHDVGRLKQEIHEKLSAEMAFKSLQELNVEGIICKKVYDSIVFHKWSMEPQTIEGKIIRDADKLDFISIPRWKSCLESNHLDFLFDLSKFLPNLRNNILQLEASKKLYDKQIIKFKKFIEKINYPLHIKLRDEVLEILS